jgi:tRNA (mo5U34)-methyltransferase
VRFDQHLEGQTPSGAIEKLSDSDLRRLNRILPWKCFTADSKGRRFGDAAWANKRCSPQTIPDPRIVVLDQMFDLREKSVLEIGCFEGVHTLGLLQFCGRVVAIDSRIENVVKTIVRTNLFGFKPDVALADIEDPIELESIPLVDVIHHVGVLYHLKDPAGHLTSLGSKARFGLLLDTHYATPEMANLTYKSKNESFSYFEYAEGGRDEVFSGMYDHAKWLLLDDIKALLIRAGFTDIRVTCDEMQRNGPRATLYAARPLP